MRHKDIIGVGLGPFNLSLAALLSEHAHVEGLFLERKASFNWHEGLLLDWTTLQVPFLADLVTMTSPTNPYSFLNYLHAHQRLYHFFFKEDFLIPRNEYNHYCQWVSNELSSCAFSEDVVDIQLESLSGENHWLVTSRNEDNESVYATKNIVLGVGSEPYLPECLHNQSLERHVSHSAYYKMLKETVGTKKHVTVIGSGQSAAEVVLDLLQTYPGIEITWLTKGKGFHPMEYSKLGLEHFSPEYTHYFYHLDESVKKKLLPTQDQLYKGISAATIADIYDVLYHQTVAGKKPRLSLCANSRLIAADKTDNLLLLTFKETQQGRSFQIKTDYVIAGTGYSRKHPACFDNINQHLVFNNEALAIAENYRVDTKEENMPNIFVQNAELHTHGIGAPDLTLGAHRSAVICNQILGKSHYRIDETNVFTSFGVTHGLKGAIIDDN